MKCYLDYNASAPLSLEVKKYIIDVLDEVGNPSSIHTSGRKAKDIIEKARTEVANLIGVNEKNIIFTSGATEANNLALNGFKDIISSRLEHESIRNHKNIKLVKIDKNGCINIEDLEKKIKALKSKFSIISVMLANNETGIIQPFEKISMLAKKYNIFFHTDAVQAVGRIPVDIINIGCDMLTMSSHKLGGPKGAGALVVNNKRIKLKSMLIGGAQENHFRAGTEALYSIAGFGKAANLVDLKKMTYVLKIRQAFEYYLQEANIGVKIIGKHSNRLPNTLMMSLPGIKAEDLLIALDLEGYEVSTGSACSSGQVEPSITLQSMGLEEKVISSAIRISLGIHNKIDDAKKFTKALTIIKERYDFKK